MNQKLMGQIRTILAALAGMAFAFGWIDQATADWLVGVGMFFFAAWWSWTSKTPLPGPPLDSPVSDKGENQNVTNSSSGSSESN